MLQFTSKLLTIKIELTFLIILVLLFLVLAKLSENSKNKFYVKAGIIIAGLFLLFGFDWLLRIIDHFTISK